MLKSISLTPLLHAGLWLTIANVLTGLLGYGYQVIMGRMLMPVDFSLFSAVMAVSMVFSSPLGALCMVISRRVSTLKIKGSVPFKVKSKFMATYRSFKLIVAKCGGVIHGAELYTLSLKIHVLFLPLSSS